MINFNRKTIVIIIIAVLIVGFGVWQGFFKKEEPSFTLTEVVRGNISQEVSETGQVKKGEEINISFKSSGEIEKIYVEVGDNVITGQDLAKLDTSQLFIQLTEAQAALEVVQAKRADTQVSLENAQQDLNNINDKAEENLNNAYEDVLIVLDDAYLKIYNTFNVVYNVQKTYFYTLNEYGLEVIEEKYRIKSSLKKVKSLVSDIKSNPQHENIDSAFPETKAALEKVSNALKRIRDITENAVYREIVSSTYKSSLDTQKLNINSVFNDIINSQQNISTIKINNKTNINAAEAKVSTLEAQLQSDGETAGLYQAQVKQAQAQINFLENQIKDTYLKSSTQGQITKINKKVGEQSMLGDSIISLLPAVPFSIEADIYEEDVVKINIGNPVDISLVAFPDQVFEGKVISIDPAEKLIEGVVYYEVSITFEKLPKGVKPGMTADLVIKTASKENVLIIPADAVQEKDGKQIVEVLKDNLIEEREIKTGLKGSDDTVEVISGLSEGESVIIPE